MPSSKAARKKQARLAFTPLPSSSPASKDYNKQIRDRAAAVILEGTPRSSKFRKIHEDDSDLEIMARNEDNAMPTPEASLEKLPTTMEIDSDDEPIRPTQRTKTKQRMNSRARQQQLDFGNSRDPDSFDSPVRLPSSSVRTRASKPGIFSSQANGQTIDISSDEGSDASDVLPSPRKLREKSKSSRNGKGKENREVVAQGDDEEGDEIAVAPRRTIRAPQAPESGDDDDDDMPTTVGKKPRRRRRQSNDSFINDSPHPALESDDDDVIVVGQRSRKRTRQETESDEEDEDDLPKTPSRRRLKRPRQMTQEEQNDLAEDLDFLRPSSEDEEPSNKPRGSQSAQKNARQQALDKLKRMRSSQLPQVDEEEQEEEELEQEAEDELYDDDEDMNPGYAGARHMFTKDEDDDGFVEEEDDEGPLGVPQGVPLQFTRYASMKSKDLFEYAVEWMVQKKINPAFQMNDDIYDLTFKKLNDEVSGLAASKFTSAAWTSDFTLALQARPEIAYERIDRNSAEHWMRDKCDACNRSGHPATYQIQFQGKPYHKETLEPVSHDDDDDDEEQGSDSDSSSSEGNGEGNGDKPDWDVVGRQIAPVNTIWYVGKFCKSNAETSHALSHWKHHLYGFVEDYLEQHKYCTAEQLVKRDRWNTKKRRKYANKVVDAMKDEGEVKQLWKMFKDNIDQARNSKQGRYAPDSP